MKIVLQIVAWGIIFIVCGSCAKQKAFKYVTYDGHIFHKDGRAAAGTLVTLRACLPGNSDSQQTCGGGNRLFEIGNCKTDGNGHFKIHEKAAQTDNYFVFYTDSLGRNWGFNSDGVNATSLQQSKFTNIYMYF